MKMADGRRGLEITPEEEATALRECVRLGYMKIKPDGKALMTDAGMKRMMGMVWAHSQRNPHAK
jgi:Mn-dependent DtxR family transcriptional regulator